MADARAELIDRQERLAIEGPASTQRLNDEQTPAFKALVLHSRNGLSDDLC
jgi:hypothetical protein